MKYIELVEIGRKYRYNSIETLENFLFYVEAIIEAFGAYNGMNAAIHSMCFDEFFGLCDNPSFPQQLLSRAVRVKEKYDQNLIVNK